MNIIGIVGQPGSGKDIAAKYIAKQYGFEHISSGNILRNYINNNSLGDLNRNNLQHTVTKLRAQYGNDVLVSSILENAKTSSNIIISGLRHPDEVKLIKKAGGKIIGINTEDIKRYQRAKMRKRIGDNISLEEFTKLVEKENKGGAWNIKKCLDMADSTVDNNAGRNELYAELDNSISQLGLSKHKAYT